MGECQEVWGGSLTSNNNKNKQNQTIIIPNLHLGTSYNNSKTHWEYTVCTAAEMENSQHRPCDHFRLWLKKVPHQTPDLVSDWLLDTLSLLGGGYVLSQLSPEARNWVVFLNFEIILKHWIWLNADFQASLCAVDNMILLTLPVSYFSWIPPRGRSRSWDCDWHSWDWRWGSCFSFTQPISLLHLQVESMLFWGWWNTSKHLWLHLNTRQVRQGARADGTFDQ